MFTSKFEIRGSELSDRHVNYLFSVRQPHFHTMLRNEFALRCKQKKKMAVALSFRHSPLDGSRAINNIRTPSIHMVTWHSVFFACSFFLWGYFCPLFSSSFIPRTVHLKKWAFRRRTEWKNENWMRNSAYFTYYIDLQSVLLCLFFCRTLSHRFGFLIRTRCKKCFGVSWNECRMCSEHGRRTNETRKSRRYYAFCWDTSAESTLVTSRSHPLSKISLRPSWWVSLQQTSLSLCAYTRCQWRMACRDSFSLSGFDCKDLPPGL